MEEAKAKVDVLKFKVGLPVVVAGEAKRMVLTIRRYPGGDEGGLMPNEVLDLAPEQSEIEIEAIRDSQVDLSIVAIDENDNVSAPIEITFRAIDSFPPILACRLIVQPAGKAFTAEAAENAEKVGGEEDEDTPPVDGDGEEDEPAGVPA